MEWMHGVDGGIFMLHNLNHKVSHQYICCFVYVQNNTITFYRCDADVQDYLQVFVNTALLANIIEISALCYLITDGVNVWGGWWDLYAA